MSRENSEWLNNNILIGDTDKRGNAWWYRQDMNATGEPTHYVGAIPTEDVQRRLFNWEPVSVPVYVKVECTDDEAIQAGRDGDAVISEMLIGNHPENGDPEPYRQWYRFIERPNRQAITASDDLTVDFNIPKSGYQIHGYTEWLLNNVANLLDSETHISSAGLLKNRANAWVEISLSDVHTVADFAFRPHLLACTSVDGTLATQYARKVQAVVCDNTLSAALAEHGQTVKVKHSKYSRMRLTDARDALGLIVATADDFSAAVEDLVSWKITGKAFNDVLNAMIPMTDEKTGAPLEGMSLTKAQNKRGEIQKLWSSDERCAPWKGTAFGVLQTFNTYDHHFRGMRGTTVRAERNMIEAINGGQEARDALVLRTLDLVAAR